MPSLKRSCGPYRTILRAAKSLRATLCVSTFMSTMAAVSEGQLRADLPVQLIICLLDRYITFQSVNLRESQNVFKKRNFYKLKQKRKPEFFLFL